MKRLEKSERENNETVQKVLYENVRLEIWSNEPRVTLNVHLFVIGQA